MDRIFRAARMRASRPVLAAMIVTIEPVVR